jgi:hypothetical protein
MGVPQELDGLWKIPFSKMDENWGYPYFRKPPNIHIFVLYQPTK